MPDQNTKDEPLEDQNQTNQNQNGPGQTDFTDGNQTVPDGDSTLQENEQQQDDSDTGGWADDDLFYEDTDPDNAQDGDYEDEEQDEECAVEWNVKSAVLQKGKITTAVKAYVTGDDEIVRYQTSNASVVAVSTSGKIKGIKAGDRKSVV